MRITIKHIAEEVGVSAMTVSRALRNDKGVSEVVRQRILQTAERLNYRPNLLARGLVSQRTHLLGVLIPNLRHSFWLHMVIGIEEVAKREGYTVLICHSDDDPEVEQQEIRSLIGRQVEALLIASCNPDHNASILSALKHERIPTVLFDRYPRELNLPYVGCDDRLGARLAAEHLVRCGYRRIAHLAGDQSLSVGRDRLLGYQEVMQEAGRQPIVEVCGFGEDNGYKGFRRLFALHRPDAIFASHDPVAIGAMRAAFEMGLRIPEDVAIVGFADMDCADHLWVPLTTVWQPKEELGRAAASLVLQTLNGTDSAEDSRVILRPYLVVRQSCGALQRGAPLPKEVVVKAGQSTFPQEVTSNETLNGIHAH
ncbi:MAG: LacI family DNA-binding transcriptional regulator [Armatimonadota bacterium]